MSRRNYKGPLAIPLPPESLEECQICKTSLSAPLNLGEKFILNDLVVHHYCVLFSNNIKQNGLDNEGLWGFLYEDIKSLIATNRTQTCIYCGDLGASIQCDTCNVSFHTACGHINESLSIFKDKFATYCKLHRPKQNIPTNALNEARIAPPACIVCLEMVNINNTCLSIWAPCCKKNWYHFNCVQKLALNQAAFFKCAVCSNKKEFSEWVVDCGIYIPERDASWELEPGAFQSHTVKIECNIEKCLCPRGRHISIKRTSWFLVNCRVCGSQGAHIKCANLNPKKKKWKWECSRCLEILKAIHRDNPVSLSGPQENSSNSRKYEARTIDEEIMAITQDEHNNDDSVDDKTIKGEYDTGCFEILEVKSKEPISDVDSAIDVQYEKIEPNDSSCAPDDTSLAIVVKAEPSLTQSVISANTKSASYSLRQLQNTFKCEFKNCTATYRSSTDLTKHEETHIKNYKCDVNNCNATFAYSSSLRTHLQKQHATTRYRCNYGNCNASFTRLNLLVLHKKTHQDEKPSEDNVIVQLYKCNSMGCKNAFTYRDDLLLHKQQQHHDLMSDQDHESKRFKCEYHGCNKTFKRSVNLTFHQQQLHLLQKDQHQRFKCDYAGCNRTFSCQSYLSMHQDAHNYQRQVNSLDKNQFNCEFEGCNKVFGRRHRLLRHQEYFHSVKCEKPIYKCPKLGCSRVFDRQWYLVLHKRCHNGRQNSNSIKKKRHICDYQGCNSSFRIPSRLLIHQNKYHGLKINSDAKIYKCKFGGCKKAYVMPSYLRLHQQFYHGVKPSNNVSNKSSNIHKGCAKSYSVSSALNNHNHHQIKSNGLKFNLSQVNNECSNKQYKCQYEGCVKSYISPGGLYKHQLETHGGKLDLKQIKNKSNTKYYKCQYEGCAKSYNWPSGLNEHQRNHHGGKFDQNQSINKCSNIQYNCQYKGCVKSYISPGGLYKHELEIHGGKLDLKQIKNKSNTKYYKCQYEGCAKSYNWPSGLNEHQRNHHGGKFDQNQSINKCSNIQYNCQYKGCVKSYISPGGLYKHQMKTHGGKFDLKQFKNKSNTEYYKCQYKGCAKSYTLKSSLVFHQRKHHGVKLYLNHMKNYKLGTKLYKCQYRRCDKAYARACHLALHFNEHLGLKPKTNYTYNKINKCDYLGCGKSYSRIYELTKHKELHSIRKFTKQNIKLSTAVKIFKCNYTGCRKSYARPSQLSMHQKTYHSDERVIIKNEIRKGDTNVSNSDSTNKKNETKLSESHVICDPGEGPSTRKIEKTSQLKLNVKRHKCNYAGCAKSYDRASQLSMHQKMYHSYIANSKNNKICDSSECQTTNGCNSDKGIMQIEKKTELKSSVKPFKCNYAQCASAFAQATDLVVHQRIHNGFLTYKCDICNADETFPSPSHLFDHKRRHDVTDTQTPSAKQFQCSYGLCNRGFDNLTDFENHQDKHLRNKGNFKCNIENCTAAFKSKRHLLIHKERHGNVNNGVLEPFKCSYGLCVSKFYNLTAFENHQNGHLKNKGNYKCNIENCNAAFKHESLLLAHKKRHDNANKRSQPVIKPFKCSFGICNAAFQQAVDLEIHQNRHTKRILHCNEKFPTPPLFLGDENRHIENTGLKIEKPPLLEIQQKFICSYNWCKAFFELITDLEIHQTTHDSDDPSSCKIGNCDTTSISQQETEEIVDVTTIENPSLHSCLNLFKCDYGFCNASYTQSSDLEIHKRLHFVEADTSNIGNFNAISPKPSQLFNLLNSRHTVEDKGNEIENSPLQDVTKQFICNYGLCKASFEVLTDLETHQITHNESCDATSLPTEKTVGVTVIEKPSIQSVSKPFICRYGLCKATFKQSVDLEIHKRRHKTVNAYACNIGDCIATFQAKSHLMKHRTRHTVQDVGIKNKKPQLLEVTKEFICDYDFCRASFEVLTDLEQHRIIHKNDETISCDIGNLSHQETDEPSIPCIKAT